VITNVPRPRPPHLHREVTRHGRVVWFVRIGKGPRTRIRAPFGTPEFDSEYQSALSGAPRQSKKGPTVGSLTWLIERYRETAAWQSYSLATRRQRENIFKHVIATAGTEAASRITRAVIVASRDRRAAKPAAARHFLDAMRGLFAWAVEAQHVKHDPTAGVMDPARKKGTGFRVWSEDEVQKYERRWPIGTRERVWLDVLLYTGLRRGDAVRLGRQHVRGGVATLKVQKSGYTIEVALPILPVLKKTLDAGPCGDLAFIAGARGAPLTKESFGNLFRDACKKAGVPGRAHGLRKLGATRAANNGATVHELQALFGWVDIKMPALYTRGADRRRLALTAAHKLIDGSSAANVERTSIPAPEGEVRAGTGKDK
jgi:integrase